MGKKKVLLIDDSETILLFEKLLLGSTYDIITAKNGRQGVEAAIKGKPDLILCDIMMPEMDGMEALRALRANEETKAIPVIMVTTKSEESRIKTCYEMGCNDYIFKPIDKLELEKKASKFLNPSS